MEKYLSSVKFVHPIFRSYSNHPLVCMNAYSIHLFAFRSSACSTRLQYFVTSSFNLSVSSVDKAYAVKRQKLEIEEFQG